jgi:hypothetical protein
MNTQVQVHTTAPLRGRIMMALVLGGAIITWVVSAILLLAPTPVVLADPALADAADMVRGAVLALAIGGASAGLVMFVGVAFTWFRPERGIGRAVLLIGGLMAILSGALLANIGLELGWTGSALMLGLVGAAVQLAVGVLACFAGLSDWLPGRSLAQHMRVTDPARLPAHVRNWLPLATVVLVFGWVLCAAAVVVHIDNYVDLGLGMLLWFVAVWILPIVAGMLVTGWRETQANRLPTLGLGILAGISCDLLFLLVLGLAYYKFNPIGFAPWWTVMGAIFGATGFALWGLLLEHRPKVQLQPG